MPNPLLDLLRQIQNPEEGADLDPIFEQLATGIEGQATAHSEALESVATRDAEISTLKAKNYDLLIKIPQEEKEPPAEGKTDEEDSETIAITDLFKKDGE